MEIYFKKLFVFFSEFTCKLSNSKLPSVLAVIFLPSALQFSQPTTFTKRGPLIWWIYFFLFHNRAGQRTGVWEDVLVTSVLFFSVDTTIMLSSISVVTNQIFSADTGPYVEITIYNFRKEEKIKEKKSA